MSTLKASKNGALRLRTADEVKMYFDYVKAHPDCGCTVISLEDLMEGFNKHGDDFCVRIDGTSRWGRFTYYKTKKNPALRISTVAGFVWPASVGFKVGDRVIYVSGRHGDSLSNPLTKEGMPNRLGSVYEVRAPGQGLQVRVKWDNGGKNSYDPKDLQLVEGAQDTPDVPEGDAAGDYLFSVGDVVRVFKSGFGFAPSRIGELFVIMQTGVYGLGSKSAGYSVADLLGIPYTGGNFNTVSEKSFAKATPQEIHSWVKYLATQVPAPAPTPDKDCGCSAATAIPVPFSSAPADIFETTGDKPAMNTQIILSVKSVDYINDRPVGNFSMQDQIDLIASTEGRIADLGKLKTKTKLVTAEIAKLKADLKVVVDLFDAQVADDA